jgi:NADPH2:quinone reductase
MKAIQITSLLISTDQLAVTTLPNLPSSEDHYVVRVQAAGTNFFDVLQVQGKHQIKPSLPFIAGNEFSGVVLKTPTRGSRHAFRVGDRVFGGGLGAFATQVYAREGDMRRLPDTWKPLDASGLFLTAPTAYTALVHRAYAKSGQFSSYMLFSLETCAGQQAD